eukprot:COSAG04_NODE_15208_length_539_cov_1.406818_2_plen_112_part_01
MLDSGVIEALDYACLNDFPFIGASTSADAAGAVVALVGRNEGGKTLSRSTVEAVLGGHALYFDPTHYKSGSGNTKLLPYTRRVAVMAVADANKKIMLHNDSLLSTLVAGLLL